MCIRNTFFSPTYFSCQVMLTADSVESCFNFCLLLLLCRKHSSVFNDVDNISSRAALAAQVLKSLAPKPPHALSGTLACIQSMFRPRVNRTSAFSTEKLGVGLMVEVLYSSQLIIKTTTDGARRCVRTPVTSSTGKILFGPGMYCRGRVKEYHHETNTYTLQYVDGPSLLENSPTKSTKVIDVDNSVVSARYGVHFFFFFNAVVSALHGVRQCGTIAPSSRAQGSFHLHSFPLVYSWDIVPSNLHFCGILRYHQLETHNERADCEHSVSK